jgi:probable F420-dependent oxidoreductase
MALSSSTRFGIGTPVVTLSGTRPAWEHTAGVEEVATIARAADRLGYHHMTIGDHVAVPPGLPRGEQFWDGIATFSYLAAITARIRFFPHVLVVPLYHPLEIIKRYGMVDMLSGGRLILGLGVGNLEEEFIALGRPFEGRGERSDDAIRAIRACMGRREVSYHGSHYSFDGLVVQPHAVQPHVPIWIGGHSKRALRRAVELADGWVPPPVGFKGPTPDELRAILETYDLPPDFTIVATPGEALNPVTEPDRTVEIISALADTGASAMNLRFVNSSLEEYLEQLEAFASLFTMTQADRQP